METTTTTRPKMNCLPLVDLYRRARRQEPAVAPKALIRLLFLNNRSLLELTTMATLWTRTFHRLLNRSMDANEQQQQHVTPVAIPIVLLLLQQIRIVLSFIVGVDSRLVHDKFRYVPPETVGWCPLVLFLLLSFDSFYSF